MFGRNYKSIKKTVKVLEKLAEEAEGYTKKATIAAKNIKKLVESDLGKKNYEHYGLIEESIHKNAGILKKALDKINHFVNILPQGIELPIIKKERELIDDLLLKANVLITSWQSGKQLGIVESSHANKEIIQIVGAIIEEEKILLKIEKQIKHLMK
jgi:hypothetical protein